MLRFYSCRDENAPQARAVLLYDIPQWANRLPQKMQFAASKRTIAGRPLSPEELQRYGALAEFPESEDPFGTHGSWVHHDRIVSCHGYVESDNENRGVLRIEREKTSEDSFELRVLQRIVHNTQAVQTLEAAMTCALDPLPSLSRWSWTSKFFDLEGDEMEGLGWKESARIEDGVLKGSSVSVERRTGPCSKRCSA
jgi:hypothetical protein